MIVNPNGNGILTNSSIECRQKQFKQQSNVCQIIVGNNGITYTNMFANKLIL